MFIEARKIIGLPVASVEEYTKVGIVREILVDPENGRLLGFLVQTGGLFSAKKVLSMIDVLEFDPNAVVTSSIDNLVNPAEILRIKEILDKNILILGMKAKTESGKSLGEVENFLLDSDIQVVIKYYLKDLLGNSRVIEATKVSRIDKAVVFIDDVVEPPKGAVGATT